MVYVNFIMTNFILDLLIGCMIKKINKLQVKFVEILFLQIFNIAVAVIYLFCGINFFVFLILKLLANAIICSLITDVFKLKKILNLFLVYVFVMFSIYGFFEFLVLFIESVLKQQFNIKTANYLHFIIIIGLFLYFHVIYCVIYKFQKDKPLQKFLCEVSFFINEKHIEIIGLLDSGNGLYDTKTGKPVVVVSSKTLKKYFEDFEFEMLMKNGFCSHTVNCEMADGHRFEMPVIENVRLMLKQNGIAKTFDCSVGIISKRLSSKKDFDCLLHRDFI